MNNLRYLHAAVPETPPEGSLILGIMSEGQLYLVGGVAGNRQPGQGDCCSPGTAGSTLK
ncbi:MAG: hypothetical protein JXJ04_26525 [Spirochaetales bacterium]|nr:hypothetical protein [Spirochaetales bacterium]